MTKRVEKNAYLVPGYACNHRCSCCPCNQEIGRPQIFAYEHIKTEIDQLLVNHVTSLTISGGEPTCHPELLKIIEYALSKDLEVQMLTNSDKFSDDNYIREFIKLIKGRSVGITTTIHSFRPEIHEMQNGSKGSFSRSIKSLKTLDESGINVSIKHCITKENYKDLQQYIEFIISTFSKNVEIQLFGIDLCGIDSKIAKKMWVPFDDLQPYLENALMCFDTVNRERNQILTVNALPLCKCDCYYWNYFSMPNPDTVLSFTTNELIELNEIFGISPNVCEPCIFKHICTGTYFSAYQIFGHEIVEPLQMEQRLRSFTPKYVSYDEDNIANVCFSPYGYITLTKWGLQIGNRRTEQSVCLRLHTKGLQPFVDAFDKGIPEKEAIAFLSNVLTDLNAVDVYNELLRKGILE